MKGNIDRNKNSSFLPGIAFLCLALFLFLFPCFAQEYTFKEMRKRYEQKDFSAVVRIYDNMRQFRREEFRQNEKEILSMTSRAMAETISSPKTVRKTSKEMKRLFHRLLILDHDITANTLHLPEKHKDVFIDSFRQAHKQLFGILIVKTNKPGIDIKINDIYRPSINSYRYTTNNSGDPVKIHLWIGPIHKKRYYKVVLVSGSNEYPHLVLLEAGKKKQLKVKIK